MEQLYTIGYEGTAIAEFIAALKRSGVRALIDVREVPISRKKGFSKNILREALERNGIRYVHFKNLGDPKPGREAARAGDHARFRRIFTRHMQTAPAQAELKLAADIAKKTPSALMCFEHDHCCCHRSIVARQLVSMTGQTVHNLTVHEALSRHGIRPRTPAQAAA